MNRAGHALQVFLLATVCAGGSAFAAKLDKDACAGLASELAALAATGIKADMERGPDWGRANLSADRLLTAQRVLEIEDQLEFRCSVRAINKPKEAPAAPVSAPPATIETRANQPPASGPPTVPTAASGSAAAASRTAPAAAKLPPATAPMALGAPTHVPPTAPAPVPPGGASASRPASPAAVGVTKSLPAAAAAAVVDPGPAKHVIAANPPPTAPIAAPAAPAVPPVTKLGPLPSAAAAVAPAPAPGPALAPGAKKPVDPAAQAARKKNQRRSSSSAYVAPGDVSPFSLPGMR